MNPYLFLQGLFFLLVPVLLYVYMNHPDFTHIASAVNLSLEQLTEHTCKYMEGHPDQKDSSFCGRKTVEKFSYCPLHLMIVFQPKGKKEEVVDKDDDVPKFIEKKVKSA